MTEQLREHDLIDFLRFAAITSAMTTTPPAAEVQDQAEEEVTHRSLVVQGDLAFVPDGILPSGWPANRRWTPITSPTRAIPGDALRFSHVMLPEGPGITGLWVAPSHSHVQGLVSVPEESRVRVTHTPRQHDDLLLGGGLWQIRLQQIVTRGADGQPRRQRAERYLWQRFPRSTEGWDGLDVAGCW